MATVPYPNVRVPPAGYTDQVSAQMKIYDLVGNLVNYEKTDNLLAGFKAGDLKSSGLNVDIYWNGSNRKGMLVAPGVYRVVLFIRYPSNLGFPDTKFVKKVGIGM